ncbi:MAG: hypothetical protein Q8R72_16495 [Hylemonella sp.]|nr:hypothetical protein [Hylemonella sp.]
MPTPLWISLLLATSFGFANAKEVTALTKEEIACEKLIKKVPKKLSQARKLAPLLKEVTAPDLDYCSDNLSRCDLRTLVFDGFSLRLLHVKASHRVDFHIARFSNLEKLREFCGQECVAAADYDEKAKQYVIDCQSNI